MAGGEAAQGDFQTAGEILAQESDPVKLLGDLRALTATVRRLQMWMQQHERRLSTLERPPDRRYRK